MAFLRFSRDRRGYEHFQLVEPVTRRGKTRTRVLYWFRTPPGIKVGREPFDEATRRALEAHYPAIVFDWRRITETPIPSAEAEMWRERRREEKAARRARKARDHSAPVPPGSAPPSEPESSEPEPSDRDSAEPDSGPPFDPPIDGQ